MTDMPTPVRKGSAVLTYAEYLQQEIREKQKLIDAAFEKNQALKAENEKLKWQIKHDQMRLKKMQAEIDELRRHVVRLPMGVLRV